MPLVALTNSHMWIQTRKRNLKKENEKKENELQYPTKGAPSWQYCMSTTPVDFSISVTRAAAPGEAQGTEDVLPVMVHVVET